MSSPDPRTIAQIHREAAEALALKAQLPKDDTIDDRLESFRKRISLYVPNIELKTELDKIEPRSAPPVSIFSKDYMPDLIEKAKVPEDGKLLSELNEIKLRYIDESFHLILDEYITKFKRKYTQEDLLESFPCPTLFMDFIRYLNENT